MKEHDIQQVLSNIFDEHTELDLIESDVVKEIIIDNNTVTINIELNYPALSFHDTLKKRVINELLDNDIEASTVNVTSRIIAYSAQKGAQPITGVTNVIAVASGKGGVGKSTTAVNLALALKAEGATVAILDADIYGPSQPRMLGVHKQKPDSAGEGVLFPVIGHGIQSMSIGYLVDEEAPMIWRGPMVTQALGQILRQTKWDNVDYMIIDLPPGTGDIQLTLSQTIPVSGAVIITTPQDIALLDATKGLKMFEKVNVPILGIIENMSLHICSNCQHEEPIFGTGGGKVMAAEAGVNFLGALPLEMSIRSATDEGNPTVAQYPDSRSAKLYREIARKLTAQLSQQEKAITPFPNITIE